MCGISGIIQKTGSGSLRPAIESMTDLIKHRGPDGFGYYFRNNIALGHRRLAILDLSENGHQPMAYADAQYVITYNGEVYNYLEIRARLETLGYAFHSQSDTEVILAAYQQWGESCVGLFNGMWAFAIHDVRRNIIFCSRDRFGVKPFYFTDCADNFVFGSETKGIKKCRPKKKISNKTPKTWSQVSNKKEALVAEKRRVGMGAKTGKAKHGGQISYNKGIKVPKITKK